MTYLHNFIIYVISTAHIHVVFQINRAKSSASKRKARKKLILHLTSGSACAEEKLNIFSIEYYSLPLKIYIYQFL